MTPATPIRSLPITGEVLAFAVEQGVDHYLPAVLTMTQRQFPNARRVQVQIEEDPEIPDDRHLVIDVETPVLDAAGYADAKFRWSRELLQLCPASLACIFRCVLEVDDS
jgi:hypothetical protein